MMKILEMCRILVKIGAISAGVAGRDGSGFQLAESPWTQFDTLKILKFQEKCAKNCGKMRENALFAKNKKMC